MVWVNKTGIPISNSKQKLLRGLNSKVGRGILRGAGQPVRVLASTARVRERAVP